MRKFRYGLFVAVATLALASPLQAQPYGMMGGYGPGYGTMGGYCPGYGMMGYGPGWGMMGGGYGMGPGMMYGWGGYGGPVRARPADLKRRMRLPDRERDHPQAPLDALPQCSHKAPCRNEKALIFRVFVAGQSVS